MGTSRTVLIDGCDLSTNRCWELNLGPLEEQPVLLTDETSLWPIECILYICVLRLKGTFKVYFNNFITWSSQSIVYKTIFC